MQLELIPRVQQDIPTLEVLPLGEGHPDVLEQLRLSELGEVGCPVEIWTSSASTRDLQYATHGLYRFFGKFPPPIARHLLATYGGGETRVLDPMCGSGTTAVEALLSGQCAEVADVNPFSVLLAKVKTRRLCQSELLESEDQLRRALDRIDPRTADASTPGLANAEHWFLPATMRSLARMRHAIEQAEIPETHRDLFKVVFASVVRRSSKATTQQGRLFLDVETAIEDVEPIFFNRLPDAFSAVSSLPETPPPTAHLRSATHPIKALYDLIICHPPYYNSYRYSSINSLEMGWLRIDRRTVRSNEVREAFKVGKPEKVHEYVEDMVGVLNNLADAMQPAGILALMIGDTVLKGDYVRVTRMLLDKVAALRTSRVAIRVPKYTEASWVASQRRNGNKLGINLCDFVVLLERR